MSRRATTKLEPKAKAVNVSMEQPEIPVGVPSEETNDVLIEQLRRYTLQACSGYAKATADLSERLSASGFAPQQALQQLEMIGMNCRQLVFLIEDLQRQQPLQKASQLHNESIEPLAAE